MKKIVPSFSNISRFTALLIVFSTLFGAFSSPAMAASSKSSGIEISGWIPYWATAKGTADTKAHISQLTEVNPFGYTVKNYGSLNDAMNLNQSDWKSLISTARKNNVKVIPTVMWSDTDNIYRVLSDPTLRAAHIASIVSAVKQNNFDGIDIDYEAKSAETRDSYTAFLAELSAALYQADTHDTLDCTIEARMPLEARYAGTPPTNIEYANDLPQLNKYCDRIRIMTYDQQTADLQLNAAHSKELYAPVADAAWVEKVIKYMAADIDKKKMVIGVGTYGYIYQAMSNIDGSGFTYTKIEAFNPGYGTQTAKDYGITPTRNTAGELSFSYVPKESSSMLPSNSYLSKLAPRGTDSGNLAAAGALAYSKKQTKQAPVEFLDWSDAKAIQDKAVLAKKLGVAGIAIFKLDGGEDPAMWKSLASLGKPIINPSTSRVITAPEPAPVVVPVTSTTTSTVVPATTTTTTVATMAAFKTDLMVGSENADVTRLQKILIAKGYLKATANGFYGPATQAAVAAWQKAVGLPSTGTFGPLSRAKIVK